MGRIKTTLIKRTARQLVEATPENFDKDFDKNKRALGHTMPSKRLRNKIAGYISRIKRNTHKLTESNEDEDTVNSKD